MHSKLHSLMKKKADKGDVLSKSHAKAKSGILQDLMDDMMGMEGDKVKGLKKVTVASNSPKGLEKGLEKAKEIVGDAPMAEDEEMPEGEEMAEGEEHEAEESPEMEVAEEESEEKEVEDLKAEIEKLKEKLAKHNLA
jgi:Ran GTPase-activating protein (RanGAP) involved in mRNA processing and transport